MPDQTNPSEYVSTAMRSRLDDLAILTQVCQDNVSESKIADMETLGFERGGRPFAEQAQQLLDEYPLAVETTTTFEIVLGIGGPDDRLLVECDTDLGKYTGEPRRQFADAYEIRRILYRYSWEGSAEVVLTGEDKATAEAFARRVVPELVE